LVTYLFSLVLNLRAR